MTDHWAAIEQALEAAYHIAECGDHPEHLLDAETKARKAQAAVGEAKRRESELREHWPWPRIEELRLDADSHRRRADKAEARVAELERALDMALRELERLSDVRASRQGIYGNVHLILRGARREATGE